jgi:hypothetical protein
MYIVYNNISLIMIKLINKRMVGTALRLISRYTELLLFYIEINIEITFLSY